VSRTCPTRHCCSASGRNADALEGVVSNIRNQGGSAIAVMADVTDPDALEELRHETQKHLGLIDFVAAVAGGGGEPVALAGLSLDRWRQTIDLNLTATFLTLKTFLPSMAERGRGAVVTVASLAGQHVL
jgi:3-oxoacyl-[acyl-carrier protein] reductase